MHARRFHHARDLRPARALSLLQRLLGQGAAMPRQSVDRRSRAV